MKTIYLTEHFTLQELTRSDTAAKYGIDIANRWFDWLRDHVDFEHLILETENGRDYWIHVSCRGNRSKNRKQVIRNLRKQTQRQERSRGDIISYHACKRMPLGDIINKNKYNNEKDN